MVIEMIKGNYGQTIETLVSNDNSPKSDQERGRLLVKSSILVALIG